MKAIRISTYGGAEVLRMEEVPAPSPGAGEALVRVAAAGVNFIEIYERRGLYPKPLPYTPGGEASGVVEAVGDGVAGVKPGDRVATVNARGSYGELAVVPADRLVLLPDAADLRLAAAALLQGMTAHYLAHSTYPLRPGDTCLVHAAAGGVGLLLCQIARRRGARVIGTVSSEAKAVLARAAGAHDVILSTAQDIAAEVRRLTDGSGVQVVYDTVGRATFESSLHCLATRGLLVLFGQSSGPVEPLDPQVLNRRGSLFLTRPALGHYTVTRDELLQRAGDVLGWVSDGSLDVRVDRTFPLAEAAEAHRALESRGTSGKLLLLPAGGSD
jgi:NADPH2:quinone reductase